MASEPRVRKSPAARRRALVRGPQLIAGVLRYVNSDEPGFTRRRHGRGFAYRNENGRPVRDRATLARIRRLAIPPAWSGVWICPDERGHIQATGRDARGRKQYRYHSLWRALRDQAKFERTLDFAEALPRLRRRIRRDLAAPGLSRKKVVATVVRLLELSLLRVGNEEYARQNSTFGLTTLRNRHAQVRGARLRFSFRGKGGKRHEVDLEDRRLARVIRQCQELPGQRLFQYVDESGQTLAIDSGDVNDYLREAMGGDFSAKDFRTWAGTLLAAEALLDGQQPEPAPTSRKSVAQAVRQVAQKLGNTPAICRRCYIHPAVIEAYEQGGLTTNADVGETSSAMPSGLRNIERRVIEALRSKLAATQAGAA